MRALIVPLIAIFLWHVSTLAATAWQEEIAVYRVGIAGDSESGSGAEPFRHTLEEKLGVPVEIFVARNFGSLLDAVMERRIDHAVLSATAYAALWNLCECVEPLAVAKSGGGAAAFRAAIFARRGGPGTVAELRGSRLAVVERDVVGGDLVAMDELTQAGLLDGADGIEIVRFKNGEEALSAFETNGVDGYLGWVAAVNDDAGTGTARQLAVRSGGSFPYEIIWRSSEIPFRVHTARSELPSELRETVRLALTAMFAEDPVAYDSIESQFGGGFEPVSQSQFNAISDALARKGIRAPSTGRRNGEEESIGETDAN